MAQQFLHGSEVCAAAQQMGGEGMSQGMWATSAMNAGPLQASDQNAAHRSIREARPAAIEKEWPAIQLSQGLRGLVTLKSFAGGFAKHAHAFFVALASQAN